MTAAADEANTDESVMCPRCEDAQLIAPGGTALTFVMARYGKMAWDWDAV